MYLWHINHKYFIICLQSVDIIYCICFSLWTCAVTVLPGELKGVLFWLVLTSQWITSGPTPQLPPKISSAAVQTKSKTILFRTRTCMIKHEHVNSSLLLSGGAQLDFSVAVSSFWSSLTPLFPASWTSRGAISLPGKTEETIWCSSRGVIPGFHLPVSHAQVYIKLPSNPQ